MSEARGATPGPRGARRVVRLGARGAVRPHRRARHVDARGRARVDRDGVLVVRIGARHACRSSRRSTREGSAWRCRGSSTATWTVRVRPGRSGDRDVVRGVRARGRRGARSGRDRRHRDAGGRVRPVGRRVGYGGGFYDRFFREGPDDAYRIGIGFDLQLVDEDLPTGHFDLGLDAIVTESGVRRGRRSPMRVSRPARRVRRRSWRDAEFASLDFEATGLDFARDAIVSFGVVPVRGGRVVLADAVHQLVDPDVRAVGAVAEDPRAPSAGSGGRSADRAGQARAPRRDPRSVPAGLVRRRRGELPVGDLRHERCAWRRRTIDVRNLAIEADGGPPSARSDLGYGLSWAAGRLGVPVASPHDALDDALVTAQAFLSWPRGRLPTGPEPTVGDLSRLAGERSGRVEQRFKLGV